MLPLCFLAYQYNKTGIVQEFAIPAIWNEVPVCEVSDIRGCLGEAGGTRCVLDSFGRS